MKITAIKQQVKQAHRVSIFVDLEYIFSLTLDQLLAEKLKVGQEVNDADIKRYKKLSEDGKLRARALEWVMLRPRSQKELRTYLYKKGVETDLQEQICKEFAKKHYQDDEVFTKWWIENRKRKLKSNNAIRAELMQKGITKSLIEDLLTEDDDTKVRLRELVYKKRNRYSDPVKFKRYLVGKGYSYSEIVEALEEVNEAPEVID